MNGNLKRTSKSLFNNKGSGFGVVIYGVTLLFVMLFTAINIVNSKVIENGYNSLRDAVQAASSGSVIHLLTTERTGGTQAQQNVITENKYDIYLQLALGYLINRNVPENSNDTTVQSGEINNFIKLDHQKVVNSTLSLLDDAIMRRQNVDISNTDEYKIMMFFIEPYQTEDGKKFFDIIAYGNGNYDPDIIDNISGKNISRSLAKAVVNSENKRSMKAVYEEVEDRISNIINGTYDGLSEEDKIDYSTGQSFSINLNSQGSTNYDQLIREMETYPHYLIVVKDFALPTIFDSTNTNDPGSGIKRAFTSISGDGRLEVPMCALNTGKVQRQVEEAGWSKDR